MWHFVSVTYIHFTDASTNVTTYGAFLKTGGLRTQTFMAFQMGCRSWQNHCGLTLDSVARHTGVRHQRQVAGAQASGIVKLGFVIQCVI